MAMKPKKSRSKKIAVPKKCAYCVDNKEPVFTDVEVLRRFLSERGKIVPRSRNGLCAVHQRRLTIAIKHARHLALLPYIAQHA